MSDTNETPGSAEPEDGAVPGRVVGTPSPADDRRLLAGRERSAAPTGRAAPVDELDEAAAKRAERIIALLFLLSFAAGIGFMVYFVGWSGRDGGMHGLERTRSSNMWLGGLMTVSFLAMAFGVTIWVRRLMTSKPIIQERHEHAASPQEREDFAKDVLEGAEDSAVKRPLLRRTLLLAAAPLGLAPLFLLRDLGPLPETRLRHTFWGEAVKKAQAQGRRGVRLLVDGTDKPLRVGDFATPGGMITVIPEGIKTDVPHEEVLTQVAKAVTILINVPADQFKPAEGRENWHVNGIVAYSKICTHVGCPAALYEQTTHHILCPCHQSTFDATDAAKVVFGPAARPLPQLPLAVEDGYLVATADFPEPIGPSFWERG